MATKRAISRGIFLLVVLLAIPAAPANADPSIAAAGNIACDTSSPSYNGGAGTATRCQQGATAKLLSPGLSAVLALGDNQYCCGALASFRAAYDASWGQLKSITRPVPGTREYATPDAAGYFDYFDGPGVEDGPAGSRGLGYYSFDLGSWHVIALNTNCRNVSCAAGSPQERWLRSDLAAHPTSCTLAFTHVPRFSSGKPGGALAVKPLWQALYAAGAEAMLSAHAKDYERFAPQAPSGRLDGAYGMRQFVVGTGGYALGSLGAAKSHSEVRQNTAFGVLELTLHPASYEWRFVPAAGASFSDAGTASCHGAPPPPPSPPAPGKAPGSRHCTIVGTPKADVLKGTNGRDVICGLGGNDRIFAGDGNDVVYGDSGNDVIYGGRGRDVLRGGRGRDKLLGGRGNDRLAGGSGNDVLRGQRGRDRLSGGGGRDKLYGNAGRDFLDGTGDARKRDLLDGGRGRDRGLLGPRDRAHSIERIIRRRR
jgi:acid phosphatase type 7